MGYEKSEASRDFGNFFTRMDHFFKKIVRNKFLIKSINEVGFGQFR